MMRRFIPPPIQAFDPSARAAEPDAFGQERDAAYDLGYAAGQRAGHIEGFAEGEAQASADGARECARLQAALDERIGCDGVAGAVAQLLAVRDADRRKLEYDTRTAIAAALDVLFPPLMSLTVGAQVVALIEQALTARTGEMLSIRASPVTVAALTDRGIATGDPPRVVLLPAPDQPPGTADIFWTGGGLTFDAAALLRAVTELVSPDIMRKDEIECLT